MDEQLDLQETVGWSGSEVNSFCIVCYLEAGVKWSAAEVYPRTSPLNNITNDLKGQ